jgi:hypothetical protein
MENLTVADALALMKSGETEGFGSGNGWWIILLFLFFLGFSGGGLNGLFGGNNGVNNGLSQLERDVLNSSCATQREVLENRYATQLGFQNLGSQMATCCCDLKTAIHSEGEATRALITNNTIEDLRERLSVANTTITSQALANDIVSAVRPVPVPAYTVTSPYTSYAPYAPYCYNSYNI